jgi:hypothetical protein
MYGSLIVPVRTFNAPPGPIAEIATMGSLAELAKRYEAMIMHRRGDDRDEYMVWDNGMLYRHTVMAAVPSDSQALEDGRAEKTTDAAGSRASAAAPPVSGTTETGDVPTGVPVSGDSIRRLRRGKRHASV